MQTKIEMPNGWRINWISFLKEYEVKFHFLPYKSVKKMQENHGMVAQNTIYPIPNDGLERINPVIAVFGGSVSASHFE